MPLAIPHKSVTGTFSKASLEDHGGITVKPSGLCSLAAYFAVVLSPERPTEQSKPSEQSLTLSFTSLAMFSGLPKSFWQEVISRKASSTEKTSTSGVNEISSLMIREDISV